MEFVAGRAIIDIPSEGLVVRLKFPHENIAVESILNWSKKVFYLHRGLFLLAHFFKAATYNTLLLYFNNMVLQDMWGELL